jgi:hypothetical protein
MTDYAKDFMYILEHLKPSKHRYEVFSDWLIMTSAALYSWKGDSKVEKEYREAAAGYSQKELEVHSNLLAITVEALEKTGQDFLGRVFTMGELTNVRNAQFFTPYHVSQMMAEIAIGELPTDHVYRVNDCCCGSGRMLIAAAMVMKHRGFNYQRNAYFIGQDIDHRCARMAFIQMSLFGMPALVVCGDTIAMNIYWERETLGYHLSAMDSRLRAERLLDFIKKIDVPVQEETRKIPEQTEMVHETAISSPKEYVQGELF